MRFLLQRVSEASVEVEGERIAHIGKGLLILLGACEGDTEEVADRLVRKALALRIFEDEGGKTNLDLAAVGGEVLVVSQFTLYANCRKGNRPSFTRAGSPERAEALYEYALSRFAALGHKAQHGSFGADMKVGLVNDGPFTVLLDSDELEAPRRREGQA